MKKATLLVGVIAITVIAATTQVQTQTQPVSPADSGNTFLALCENAEDLNDATITPLKRGICLGYVNGVCDGIVLAQSFPTAHPDYCLPTSSDNAQVFDTVVKFIKEHPEVRHWQTRELVIRALMEAFPCPTTAKGVQKKK